MFDIRQKSNAAQNDTKVTQILFKFCQLFLKI